MNEDTAELDDMKDSKRKSVNAFHLFFVCPNVERICLHAILHLNLEAKSEMKP